MRTRELEDVLKLVDAMPRDRQLECVRHMTQQVELWEQRVSFNGTEWEFAIECIKRRREREAAEKKRKPPLRGGSSSVSTCEHDREHATRLIRVSGIF